MFTGIVEELGEVVALDRRDGAARLTVRGPAVAAGAAHGDSIAVNGVCLTVTDVDGAAFTADVMGETLRRSGLGTLAPGSPVNLERPLRLDGRLGGHLVQGHVDGVGEIISRTRAPHWEVVRITIPNGCAGSAACGACGGFRGVAPPGWHCPNGLARYVAAKGSVAVDGVSLTVSALGGQPAAPAAGEPAARAWLEVSLIPATLELTTLGRKQPGDTVNLEVDVVAKYVETLLAGRPR